MPMRSPFELKGASQQSQPPDHRQVLADNLISRPPSPKQQAPPSIYEGCVPISATSSQSSLVNTSHPPSIASSSKRKHRPFSKLLRKHSNEDDYEEQEPSTPKPKQRVSVRGGGGSAVSQVQYLQLSLQDPSALSTVNTNVSLSTAPSNSSSSLFSASYLEDDARSIAFPRKVSSGVAGAPTSLVGPNVSGTTSTQTNSSPPVPTTLLGVSQGSSTSSNTTTTTGNPNTNFNTTTNNTSTSSINSSAPFPSSMPLRKSTTNFSSGNHRPSNVLPTLDTQPPPHKTIHFALNPTEYPQPSPASPPPLSPNTCSPSQFLTIKDIEDVSPLSSFSGPSKKPHSDSVSSTKTVTGQMDSSVIDQELDQSISHASSVRQNSDPISPLVVPDPDPQSQSTQPQQQTRARSSSRPITPVVFPDPQQVFDARDADGPAINPLPRHSSDIGLSTPMHFPPPSSTTSLQPPKRKSKKSSFISRLIYRRESSEDSSDSSVPSSSASSIRHKRSESTLAPGQNGPHGILHRPSYAILNTGRQALHHVHGAINNGVATVTNDMVSHGSHARSSSSSSRPPSMHSESAPASPVPLTTAPPLASSSSASATHAAKMQSIYSNPNFYPLDTDLEHMNGIVNPKPPSNGRASTFSPTDETFATTKSKKHSSAAVSPTSTPMRRSATTELTPTTTMAPQVPQSSSNSTAATPTADPAANWTAPESWNIVPSFVPGKVSPFPARDPSEKHCVRIFREDDTFGTLFCRVDVTVKELIQLIGKKFYMGSVAGHQLTVRIGGLTRILNPEETPLVYQSSLLELMGYTEKDRIGEVGREDLSYLCRFKLTRSKIRTVTDNEKAILSRDFSHVQLQHMDLQTIPVFFYPHASKIEFLDVSENPSISIPSDFIQACHNLREIRYVHNQAYTFPPNVILPPQLGFLDIKDNLIKSLDDVDFLKLSNLTFIDLQGNLLDHIPDSFSQLQSLRYLNLSSNNIEDFPNAICKIVSLVDFDISFNKIADLPNEIGQLENLEKLAISNSYLSKRLPDTFVNLVSLKELDLRYNKIQNIDLLARLPKLEVLYVSKNSITSFDAEFPKLKLFYFDRNPITNIDFRGAQSTLTAINLSKAQMAGVPDALIDRIPLVERLVLDKNHITTLPPKIGMLKNLKYLSVVSNSLDSVPAEIGQLHNLVHLDLHDNNILHLPSEIWNLSSLVLLNVASNLLDSFPKSPTSHSSISSSDSERREVCAMVSDMLAANSTMPATPEARRPSTLSISSSYDEYKPQATIKPVNSGAGASANAAAGTATPIIRSPKTSTSTSDSNVYSTGNRRQPSPMALSLLTLILCDNRLTEDCFDELSLLTELQILNLSYNDIGEVPYGALRRFSHIVELYLSGNKISSLPGDDLEALQGLQVFHVNSNKLHNLPAELGKIAHLGILDVGSNILKYNIHNWPYDWNWRFNHDLKYLNFSGNRRLEVNSPNIPNSSYRREVDMSDFTVLSNIRVLGLMDVTLTALSVPDQSANCRVRTYGSEIQSYPYGLADSLGHSNNLSVTDMVLERFRGKDNEIVIGLFDGRGTDIQSGNKVSKLVQETFGSIFQEELKKLRKEEVVEDALRRAFLNTNKEIGNTILMPTEEVAHTPIGHRSSTAINLEYRDGMTGSCATIVYVADNKLYVANAGDSMAIIAHVTNEYSVLTTRHDPTSQKELKRIRRSGGIISSTGQLDDLLDVSRAIGFYNLIPHIHASPSVTMWEISDADEMVILASKQLWEYVSYQTAVDIARTEKGDLMRAAAKLRDFAIAYGASDKILVMVIGVGLSRKRVRTNKVGAPVYGTNGGDVTVENYDGTFSRMGDEYSSHKKRRDKGKDSELARLGGEVEPPQGELAIVFTDIKNSTSLWESHAPAMRSAIKLHNGIMRRQMRITGGYEVKTEGDAFVVSFPTPTSALLWCLNVQQQLLLADWPAEILETEDGCEILDDKGQLMYRGLSVRMGIHWGSPVCETDPITRRMDYFGPMVNKAARISAVADGGQISLSSDFVSEMKQIRAALDAVKENKMTLSEVFGGDEVLGWKLEQEMKVLDSIGWEIKELGEYKLKGLENPEFINLGYPKQLLGRFEHHLLSKKKRSEVRSSRYGSLSLEQLPNLRLCAVRLEHICSSLNPCTTISSDGAMPPLRAFPNKEPGPTNRTTNQLGIMLPNNEYEYGAFLDNIVTRVENAVTTLTLRTAMDKFKCGSGTAELNELLHQALGIISQAGHAGISQASRLQELPQLPPPPPHEHQQQLLTMTPSLSESSFVTAPE